MAESSPAHEPDDGQINLEFDEEAQEVVLEEDSQQTAAAPEPVETEEESIDEHEQYGKSVQKRINQLTKRAREAEREREEAVKFAQAVQQENQSVKQRLHNLDKNYIDEYGNRVSSEQQRAKDELKAAIETGDTDRQLEAQEKFHSLLLLRIVTPRHVLNERLRPHSLNKKCSSPLTSQRHKRKDQIPKQKSGQKITLGSAKTLP